MRNLIAIVVALVACTSINAQVDGLLHIHDPLQQFLERQQTRGLLDRAVLSHQPLSAYEAMDYVRQISDDPAAVARLSSTDRRLLDRFLGTSPGPGAEFANDKWGAIFSNGRDLFSVEGDDFGLQLSPLAYLTAGSASQTQESDVLELAPNDRLTNWRNTRGVRAAGHLGDHIFFETRVEENQRVDPVLNRDIIGERIGERYFRDGSTYDYWVVTGVAGVRTKYTEIRFGRDRSLWSAGRGSLLLSNYTTTHDQIQLRTKFWRLQYTNVFAALGNRSAERDSLSGQYRARYGVFHRLAIDLPGRVQVGLSEASILAPTPEDRGPEFYMAYLNPIIFIRALDFELGSPANMLIALDAQWVATSGLQVYGQFMLDEFRASELFGGNGWLHNKWGGLVGFHAVGLGIPDLEVRGEYARVRPYTYTSRDTDRAFAHNFGVLGHPFGPNAESVALWLNYRPTDRLTTSASAFFGRRGRNEEGVNWGADPLVPYNLDVPMEFGHHVGQGIGQTETRVSGRATYELLPNLFVEGMVDYTVLNDDGPIKRSSFLNLSGGIRWGLPYQSARF